MHGFVQRDCTWSGNTGQLTIISILSLAPELGEKQDYDSRTGTGHLQGRGGAGWFRCATE
jgi:hypothetical protein